jgi:hypothetical protein
MSDYQRFANLSFDDFRRMAADDSLSRYEKIGFPDDYRSGKEARIFADILAKLPHLSQGRSQTVLDIGPGCSELPELLIAHCREFGHRLILVDSAEMLERLPNEPFIYKVAGYYPDCQAELESLGLKMDIMLCYSVLHYIFAESNLWYFLDYSLSLMAEGGQFLIGDIPNSSQRKRFFSSANGIRFHQQFMQTDAVPTVEFNTLEPNSIDDSVLLSLVMRSRQQGFDAYLLPQPADLPMANRREDLLICRP